VLLVVEIATAAAAAATATATATGTTARCPPRVPAPALLALPLAAREAAAGRDVVVRAVGDGHAGAEARSHHNAAVQWSGVRGLVR
jgi:hypothetical protein